MSDKKVLMAQIEVKSGDLDGNLQKIEKVIQASANYDVVLFPELAISGYNVGALFEDEEFINDCLERIKYLATLVKDQIVIIGAPRFGCPKYKQNGNLRLHNSAFILHNGTIVGVYDKIHLANDFQHEDRKYFYPGKETYSTTINGHNFAVLICEDIWKNDHSRDLLAELKHKSPGIESVYCLNFSYYTYEKQKFRLNLITQQAKDNNVNIFYCNAVGIGDIVKNIILYDGNSFAVNKLGRLIVSPKSFKPAILSYPGILQVNILSTEWDSKYKSLFEAHCYAIREYYAAARIENAIIAVSGGIDSALNAVLAVQAMGKDKVKLVSMPSHFNGDVTKNAAQQLADKLQVKLHWTLIQEIQDAMLKALDNTFEGDNKPSDNSFVTTTIDAVSRTVLGQSLAHYWKGAVLPTGNHTENILGWCTFNDIGSVGTFMPLGDMTKTEIFEYCAWLNYHLKDEIIPEGLYNGKIQPMAELADNKGGADPFDYYLMSGICAELIRHRKSPKKIIADYDNETLTAEYFPTNIGWNMKGESTGIKSVYDYPRQVFVDNVKEAYRRSKISVFKSAQHAPTLIISPRSRGFSARETIINYYQAKF